MGANVWGTRGSDSSWKPPSLAVSACNYFHLLQLAEGTLSSWSTQDPSSIVTLTFRISKQASPWMMVRELEGCALCVLLIFWLCDSLQLYVDMCVWGAGTTEIPAGSGVHHR